MIAWPSGRSLHAASTFWTAPVQLPEDSKGLTLITLVMTTAWVKRLSTC